MSRDYHQTEIRLSLLEYTTRSSYLAPEGLLGSLKYTCAIDMWSLGCIIVEIISGKKMLEIIKEHSSGANPLYLRFCLRLTGIPDANEIKQCKIAAKFKHMFKETIDEVKNNDLVFRDYKQFLPEASDLELNLLKKIFVFSPKKRITAKELLEEISKSTDWNLNQNTQNFPSFNLHEKSLKNTSNEEICRAVQDFINSTK